MRLLRKLTALVRMGLAPTPRFHPAWKILPAACLGLFLAACAQERSQAKPLLVSVQPVAQVAATSGEMAALGDREAPSGGTASWDGPASRPLELGGGLSPSAYSFKDTLDMAAKRAATGKPVTLSAVPLHALARATGGFEFTVHVVRETDGRTFAQARTVTVAQVAGSMVTILSGVRPGELVITSGTTLASDGQEVRFTRN